MVIEHFLRNKKKWVVLHTKEITLKKTFINQLLAAVASNPRTSVS